MARIVVIAGPSGSGKNTVIKRLLMRIPLSTRVITATTRLPRPGEADGDDYYFFTIDRFDEERGKGNIAGQRFVPLYGGTYYGIYLPDLKKRMETYEIIFAPVDIEGARYLKSEYGATTIFIMPESLEEFRGRLRVRNPEWSEAEFDMRMKITEREMSIDAQEFDHRVINADGALEETTEQVLEILRKEKYNL